MGRRIVRQGTPMRMVPATTIIALRALASE